MVTEMTELSHGSPSSSGRKLDGSFFAPSLVPHLTSRVPQYAGFSQHQQAGQTDRLLAIVSTQSTAKYRPEAERVNPSNEDEMTL